MKKIAVFVLVLALACPLGWTFAQDQKTVSWEEHLTLARTHAQAQIALRQSQIQRLQDQIAVWQSQLDTIKAELKKLKEEKNPKEEKAKVSK